MPNKLSHFWHELKRRKVFKVIAMYAGTAYVLIELSNNVVEPLNLPSWTPRLIILIALIGFPVVAVLSWIFDITPEGIKKTPNADLQYDLQISAQIPRRKIRVSDGIIAILLILVCILLYPKIFNRNQFKDLRENDGRISIAVMPFENMTADSSFNIWEEGVQINLITKLTDSDILSVRQYETVADFYENTDQKNYASISPGPVYDVSQKLKVKTFLQGTIFKSGDRIRMSVQMGDANKEEILKSFEINLDGSNKILEGIDSLSYLIRNYLEIEVLRLEKGDDQRSNSNYLTSTEAYRYYLLGRQADQNADYPNAIKLYERAVELDSSFLSPQIEIALAYYGLGNNELWEEWIARVLGSINEKSAVDKLKIEFYRALYEKDIDKLIEVLEERLLLDDQSRNSWLNLGWAYMQLDQYENAITAFEKALDIVNEWKVEMREALFYAMLMEAYHETGRHRKEKKLAQQGLKILPENQRIIQLQAVCELNRGSLKSGARLVDKYRELRAFEEFPDAMIENQTAWIYRKAGMLEKAEEYYRSAVATDPENPWHVYILSWFLIEFDINLEEGMEIANSAQEQDPEDYHFFLPRGIGHFKQGNFEEALFLLKNYEENIARYDHSLDNYIKRSVEALSALNDK